ncbi:MAG: hypothetical protein ACE5IO_03600 [Thermoplasmata archaeon]
MIRKKYWFATYILILFVLWSFSGDAGDNFLPPEEGIVVDVHWIDMVQDDSLHSFHMKETLFFNNTGDKVFNGTVYVWLPQGATILASCCGQASDMACRLESEGSMSCYSVWQIDENVVSLVPFPESSFLSFYGQNAVLNLTVVSSINASNGDYLPLDVVVGGYSAVAEDKNTSAARIHLLSENATLGARLQYGTIYPPLTYKVVQNLELFNNGNESDVFNLDVDGLPEGWQASFASQAANITSISVAPSERVGIELVIEVPSYKASILIEYQVDLESKGEGSVSASFEKEFLYNSTAVEYYVFLLEGSAFQEGNNVTMLHPNSGMDPIWDEASQRYWYIAGSRELVAGARADMQISWVVETDYLPFVLISIFLGLVVLLVALPLIRRRKRRAGRKVRSDVEELQETAGDKGRSVSHREVGVESQNAVALERAIERVEKDHEKGLISKEQARLLTSKLKSRAAIPIPLSSKEASRRPTEHPKTVEGAELSEYVTRLGTLKKIVKELDIQFEAGKLPEDIYHELRADYDAKIEDTQSKMESWTPKTSEQTALTQKKKMILEVIEKLRNDVESGKLSEGVYTELKTQYEERVADINKSIEEGGGE